MKTNRKHGFTVVELVVVIAIIAVLAAVLIPTFISIVKKANDSAYLQEKTNQRIEDLAEKVENQNYLSWEDFEAKLAVELAKISSETSANVKNAVDAALKEYMKDDIGGQTGLTEEKVQKIVEKALEGQLTTAQVEVIVRQALKENNTSVDATTINTIVNAAVSKATQGGVTAAQMKAAIKEAINGITHPESSLTEEQITAVINAAITEKLESMDTLTEAEISALITAALEKYEVDKGTAIAITDADVATGSYEIAPEHKSKTFYLVTTATKDEFSITGGTADTIIYIDAPNIKTINVDNAKEVYVIRTAQTSVHITGTVSKLEINSGRVVIEESATVTDVKAAPLTSTTAIVEVMEGGTVTNPVVAEYQDHGFGTNDFIQIIDHNTVEEKQVDVKLTASDALVVSSWTTTNVVLNDVSASNVEVDSGSKERLTNSAVEVTIDSGNGEPTVLQTTASGETTQKVGATLTIGGVEFEEFDSTAVAAINALESGTVVLYNNVNIDYTDFGTKFINIASNHEVTIDLNGHTITAYTMYNKNSAFISNEGTLVIKDSKAGANGIGSGKITVSATEPDGKPIPSYASNLITNLGNLTILSGQLYNAVEDGGAAFAIDTYSNNGKNVSLTINGGKITTAAAQSIRQAVFTNTTNDVVINGGVVGSYWIQNYGTENATAHGSLVINDVEALYNFNFDLGYSIDRGYGLIGSDVIVKINGGNFKGLSVRANNTSATNFIYGGTFSTKVKLNGDGVDYTINGGTFNDDIICEGTVTRNGGTYNALVRENYATLRVWFGSSYITDAIVGEDYTIDTGDDLSGKVVSAKYYGDATAEVIDSSKITINGSKITIDKTALHKFTGKQFCIWVSVSDAE